ncbi:uncharacterized protein LOC133556133 isoform X2 [Nerophis ophidion]|uniref:uncharacterized protein LOC133556133 isoform X2 n=1 Tax=Nerophis ophidion TaxID=159077 RepID=UPI002AE05BEA|nr:uncharacterized protein LOC133556133 isoform X2 [Nerophis ophidion]XP_061761750.1 uncharacterized protein LOC133556133 isoform X2 [Nerophis ophidion]
MVLATSRFLASPLTPSSLRALQSDRPARPLRPTSTGYCQLDKHHLFGSFRPQNNIRSQGSVGYLLWEFQLLLQVDPHLPVACRGQDSFVPPSCCCAFTCPDEMDEARPIRELPCPLPGLLNTLCQLSKDLVMTPPELAIC